MCLAIPGKILEIDRTDPEMLMARVDFSGTVREICVQWVPEVQPGDYVLAHVGTAISCIREEEALETLELLRQMKQAEDDTE